MKSAVKYKFHLLIFILSLLVLTRFYIDADLGWHIAIGRAFLEGRGIIRNDQFSWTMAGHFWGNSYFLYQIVVAWLFKNAGYLATVFLFGFAASVSVILLLPKKLNMWSFFIVLVGIAMASTSLGIRPHVFDFLFFAILLVLLEKGYYKKNILAPFWFVFFLLWANFHLGFLIGLMTFSAFVVIDVLKARSFGKTVQVGNSLLLLTASWLGSLFTPFHVQMYKSIFVDSTSPLAWLYVYELQPIVLSFTFMAFYLTSGLVFIYVFRLRHREIGVEWFLAACVLFMLPFVSYFYVLFWSEIFIFLGTRYFNLNFKFLKRLSYKQPIYISLLIYIVLLALVLDIFVSFGKQVIDSRSLDLRFAIDKFPVEAMRFMVSNGYTSHLYNNYNWGGYIDWQYPNVKVGVDGRMTGWRNEQGRYIFEDYIKTEQGNCDFVKNMDVQVALLTKPSKARCFSGWNNVYADKVAKVLVKPQ